MIKSTAYNTQDNKKMTDTYSTQTN